ncbi:MAG: hypothetical protein GF398_05060 [Chitinivibrionales bacterium]|nr:hypothetical protein [Chitinivibrionales bacterium]
MTTQQPGKNLMRHLLIIMTPIFLSLAGEPQHCVLTGYIPQGKYIQEAYTLDDFDATTIDVPASVTRMSQHAIFLAIPRKPDSFDGIYLSYLIDHSSSMNCQGVQVRKDTTYCANGIEGPIHDVTIPYDDSNKVIKRCAQCSDKMSSGDPHAARAKVVRRALQKQKELIGGFASVGKYSEELDTTTDFLDVSNAADFDALTRAASISLTDKDAVWRSTLTSVKQMFSDSSVPRDAKKAIVIVTDGRDVNSGWEQVLAKAYGTAPGFLPPVYGIFLGTATDEPVALDNLRRLCDQTAGTFYRAPHGDETIIDSIITVITTGPEVYKLRGIAATMRNTATGQLVNGSAPPFRDTNFLVTWQEKLLFNEGENAVELTIDFRDGATHQVAFTINVAGDAKPDRLFTASCSGIPELAAKDETWQTTYDTLTGDLGAFNLFFRLKMHGRKKFNVRVFSRLGGDTETVIIDSAQDRIGRTAEPDGRFVMSKLTALSFLDSAQSPSRENEIVEVAFQDSLVMRWENPDDLRDTAVAFIPVLKEHQPLAAGFRPNSPASLKQDALISPNGALRQLLATSPVPIVSVQLFDALGNARLILDGSKKNVVKARLGPLGGGIYFIRVKTIGHAFVKRVEVLR